MALCVVLGILDLHSMDGFWLILTATPAQRCKAMLAAVREC